MNAATAAAAAIAAGRETVRNKWFVEPISEDFMHVSSLKRVEFSAQSKFQDVDIVHLGSFGRCLVLDNKLQSSDVDEHVYHESLVQPAMLAHPNPKTVFIGGGGEGATLREVLRHPSVEKCYMVDLDEEVVKMCGEILPKYSDGTFEDPRTELRFEDAKEFLINFPGKFDVIIMDLCDPVPGGPCYTLYAKEFYQFMATKLNPGGVLVTQSGPAGITSFTDVFSRVHCTMREAFPERDVRGYRSHLPSFLDMWGFNMVTFEGALDIGAADSAVINQRIQERLGSGEVLKYYDGTTSQSMFALDKQVRAGLKSETSIITEENPAYLK